MSTANILTPTPRLVREKPNMIHNVAANIKSVDGIDELATLLGQILPGIAGPIATTSVLTFAAPFVWLGIIGMKEEYEEALQEFQYILEDKATSRDKLAILSLHSAKYTDVINRKLGLNIKFDPNVIIESDKMNIDRLAKQILVHQKLQNDKLIAGIEKRYGWNGALGMAGMFAGILTATGAAVSEIIAIVTSNVVAANVASMLVYASGGTFIVGQTAMSIYAGSKAHQGFKKVNQLKSLKSGVDKSVFISNQSKSNVSEILQKEADFIKRDRVRYGIATIIGQSFMFAGVVASLSGVGILASVPLFVIGTAFTIVPAVDRIITEKRESYFKGLKSAEDEYVLEIHREFTPATLLENYDPKDPKRFIYAAEKVGAKLNEINSRIAASKGLDLLYYAVNGKSFQGKTPEEKLDKLKKRVLKAVKTGTIKSGKVTGEAFENNIIQGVKQFIEDNKDELIQFLNLDTRLANNVLKSTAEGLLENGKFDLSNFPKELTKLDQAIAFVSTSKQIENKKEYKKELKEVRKAIKGNKSTLKAARMDLAHDLAYLIGTKKMSEEIQQEISDQELIKENRTNPNSKVKLWKDTIMNNQPSTARTA